MYRRRNGAAAGGKSAAIASGMQSSRPSKGSINASIFLSFSELPICFHTAAAGVQNRALQLNLSLAAFAIEAI